MKANKLVLSFLAILLTGFSPLMKPFTGVIFAEEIVISGNGSESANAVSSTTQTETAVQQSNQSETTNTVSGTSETGSNEASKNTGDTAIQTGNTESSVGVTNQGNISSVDTSSCCQTGEKTITVSGNGDNSTNTVDANHTATVTTTVHQNATITNTITGTANTGGNKANNNGGDAVIITGNIFHKETVMNGPINISSISVGLPSKGYMVKVNGNGAGSVNTTNISENISHLSYVTNTTTIINNSFWDLITGNNTASGNNGDVTIKTGDIVSVVSITNKANESVIKDECCKNPSETPAPTPTPKDENKPGNNNGGGSGGGSGSSNGSSSSTGPSGGHILPITGTNWIMLALFGNIAMLFLGVVLRLRSGRSPGFRYNFVI
ncbi:MAG: hypothetical protein RLZZ455_1075 [Candidatus Parcubacteria bacterium]|jgi:hypothetical protein